MTNPAIGVYSFLDVSMTFDGPGGSFGIAQGGVSAEGVTVAAIEDKGTLTMGAGGDGMHNLKATKAARVTIRVLKTGTINALLGQIYNFQSQSSANWGRNHFTLTNGVTGDNITGIGGGFVKEPDVVYAVEGGIMEWAFNFVAVDKVLGNQYQPTGILLV